MTAPRRRPALQRVAGWAALVVLLAFDLVATGWFGANERVVAMCRNLVLPGLGFLETDPWLAVLYVVAAMTALAAWLRWGTDWIVGVVWVSAVLLAFLLVPTAHTHVDAAAGAPVTWTVDRSSHEFAAVLVLVAALSRARLAVTGLPGVRRLAGRRSGAALDRAAALAAAPPVVRCRAVAIGALASRAGCDAADPVAAASAIEAPDVRRRAARVAAVARFRLGGDPLRRDNAPARAAAALLDADVDVVTALRADARRSPLGAPASEPTWVRLLDGTLVALALDATGERAAVARWRDTLASELRLRHGRRGAAVHTPTSWRLLTAPPWEHATATALARWRGWIGDDDWAAIRQRSLGAAARGARREDDARLVAAARLWAHLCEDAAALRILERPTRSSDPIAAALDDVVAAVAAGTGVS